MLLKTKRLILRAFTMEDAQDLQDIFGDEETMKNCEPAYSMEKTRNFLQNFCIDRRGALAAELSSSHKVIGYILFNELEPDVYEIGWIFHRAYWRQGYAYEGCKAVLDYAFQEKQAHKVFAEAIDPVKSVGLMKKLGMHLEGIQRDQGRDNDGNWASLYFYGILEEEWKAQSEGLSQ